jgi:hypothetical protein
LRLIVLEVFVTEEVSLAEVRELRLMRELVEVRREWLFLVRR